MKWYSFLFLFFFVLSLGCSQSSEVSKLPNPGAETEFQAKYVLFIGNSHTNYNLGIDHYLKGFTSQAGLDFSPTIEKITMDGASIQDHLENANTLAKLNEKNWDVVIFQENSTVASEQTTETITSLQEMKFALPDNKTKIYLFMTWAYEAEPAMLTNIRATYEQAAPLVSGIVVPIGLAFKEIADDSTFEVTLYNADGIHPSIEGSYLSAAMFYAAIYNKDPVLNSYSAGLETSITSYLKGKANEVWMVYQN
ncbi:DUF4886 domain-containing protein [Muriicola sp. E247]|uniref:DUF4886 domain-containing protein n=1 Tax=Muriicola sp. E247 TaxID=3242730 RepID=UPI0035233E26